jgi:nucleosome binding factor SPN SPT16 subunit
MYVGDVREDAMCHFHESGEWNRARKRDSDDADDADDEIPSFLTEEADTDVEVLTDGGNDEE